VIKQSTKTDALAQLCKADAVLKKITSDITLPRWTSTNNVFHDLMSCIIEQQIHYRSSKLLFQHLMNEARLVELTTGNFGELEKVLPGVRLSVTKYEAMAHVLDFFGQNDLDWALLNDEEVASRLSVIKGIGRWTIDMVLLYTLRRPDVFPVDDYHLKQIMTALYGFDPQKSLKKQMLAVADCWGKQRSLAVLYLLAWKDIRTKTKGRVYTPPARG
jgi:DNA-3-methyladenine glycosylase II